MFPLILLLVCSFGLASLLLWLLFMASLSARARLWPRRALLVAGAAPGGVVGYAAVYASLSVFMSRQAPLWLLVGAVVWMLAFAAGAALLIYHRHRLLGAIYRPVSTSLRWLLASGTFMLAGLFIADGYSNTHVERLRQMPLFGPPMGSLPWPEPHPKWALL